MDNFYCCAANAIGVVHLAVVAFVVIGSMATCWGILRRRDWMRNFYFRIGLLAVVWLVAVDDLFEAPCPLTVLEEACRVAGHQAGMRGQFIPTLIYDKLNIDVPQDWYVAAHLSISVMLAAACIVSPPRWPSRHRAEAIGGLIDVTAAGLENTAT